jgi:UDP-N-acetylmuramate: L-alanyl-gamma-D-glutamyl-meso-diaminopimelate ligase
MKSGVMRHALPDSLQDADQIFCFAGSLDWDAAESFAPLGNKVLVIDDFSKLLDAIVSAARPGDHILVMSNGGFGGIHEKLLERLHD